jgi:AbiV family abortive infection protein
MVRLPQYRSKLTPEQIAEGMTRTLKNAERLAKDAELLMKAASVPSAVALAILSIEESGKVSIFRQMAAAVEEKEWAELWKAYRTHTKKNTLWIFGDLVKNGARALDDLLPIVDADSDHPDVLDQLKQLSIYTDCFTNAKWSSPSEVDLNAIAPYLVKMAKIFGKPKTVTVKEVQLWQKHLLPVKNAPMETQKAAVAAWFQEMGEFGLYEASSEQVGDFLGQYDAS